MARPPAARRRPPGFRVAGRRRARQAEEDVRLDRVLHCIRQVKSRTLAQALIATGHVRIDGKRVEKPSEEVRIGNIVAFPLWDRVRILKVLGLPARRGSATEARSCYEELGIDEAGAPS